MVSAFTGIDRTAAAGTEQQRCLPKAAAHLVAQLIFTSAAATSVSHPNPKPLLLLLVCLRGQHA